MVTKIFLFYVERGFGETMAGSQIPFSEIMVTVPLRMLHRSAGFYRFTRHKLQRGMILIMMDGWMCSSEMNHGKVTRSRGLILRSYFLTIRMEHLPMLLGKLVLM